jgi:hypothetical protein
MYDHLIEQIDALVAMLSSYYSRHLICHAGCSGCCYHHLSIFAIEAAAVRRAIESVPDDLRGRIEAQARSLGERESRGEKIACPLLVDDRCSIYESRPIICRTQGLPLLLEADDGAPEVDFCPLNFTLPGAIEDLDEDHLVPLDQINLKLAAMNLQYCRERGIIEGQRYKMSDIVLKTGAVKDVLDKPLNQTKKN